MRLFLFFTSILLVLLSCQKEQNFEKFSVNKDLPNYDTIQLLTKYPELKLYNSEIVESRTRTAYIVQKAFYYDGLLKGSFILMTINVRLNIKMIL